MVNWTDVKSQLAIALSSEDLDILFAADEGDLDSQNDIGQLLACAQRYDAALYWIRQAAEKDHPDAMQWLGGMYAAGEGVTRDENMALMWIAKAAALNHTIASQQIKNLLPKK